jgi:choline dehydrogenase-like flavoprotein
MFTKQVPSLESFFSDGYSGASPAPDSTSPFYNAHFFTIFSVVMHPFACGTIHIDMSDPTSKPVIDPKYASHPYDPQAIFEAAKFNRKIAEAPSLRYSWTDEYDPGLSVTTDAEWENWARNNTLSIYHPLGSCSVLRQENGGVVDPDLKVYGTQNLRDVDASIIPILPVGHLQTMVYGIAERAADIIVAQHSA